MAKPYSNLLRQNKEKNPKRNAPAEEAYGPWRKKESLQKQLSQRQLEKMLTDLRAKATIVDNSKPAAKK